MIFYLSSNFTSLYLKEQECSKIIIFYNEIKIESQCVHEKPVYFTICTIPKCNVIIPKCKGSAVLLFFSLLFFTLRFFSLLFFALLFFALLFSSLRCRSHIGIFSTRLPLIKLYNSTYIVDLICILYIDLFCTHTY